MLQLIAEYEVSVLKGIERPLLNAVKTVLLGSGHPFLCRQSLDLGLKIVNCSRHTTLRFITSIKTELVRIIIHHFMGGWR